MLIEPSSDSCLCSEDISVSQTCPCSLLALLRPFMLAALRLSPSGGRVPVSLTVNIVLSVTSNMFFDAEWYWATSATRLCERDSLMGDLDSGDTCRATLRRSRFTLMARSIQPWAPIMSPGTVIFVTLRRCKLTMIKSNGKTQTWLWPLCNLQPRPPKFDSLFTWWRADTAGMTYTSRQFSFAEFFLHISYKYKTSYLLASSP